VLCKVDLTFLLLLFYWFKNLRRLIIARADIQRTQSDLQIYIIADYWLELTFLNAFNRPHDFYLLIFQKQSFWNSLRHRRVMLLVALQNMRYQR